MQLIMQLLGNCPAPTKAAVRRGSVGPIQKTFATLAAMRACGVQSRTAARLVDVTFAAAIAEQRKISADANGHDFCDQIESEIEGHTS